MAEKMGHTKKIIVILSLVGAGALATYYQWKSSSSASAPALETSEISSPPQESPPPPLESPSGSSNTAAHGTTSDTPAEVAEETAVAAAPPSSSSALTPPAKATPRTKIARNAERMAPGRAAQKPAARPKSRTTPPFTAAAPSPNEDDEAPASEPFSTESTPTETTPLPVAEEPAFNFSTGPDPRPAVSSETAPLPDPTPTPTPEPVAATPEKPSLADEDWNHFWVWLGYGMSYTNLQQDAGALAALNVSGFNTGALVLRAGFWLSEKLGLNLGFKQTPGKVLSSSSLSVDREVFQWKTATGEVIYRNTRTTTEPAWSLRVGVQNHTLPFLVPLSASAIELVENSVLTASIGAEYKKPLSQKVSLEVFLRYQHPFSANTVTGASYSVQSPFVFDGSIGATYRFRPDMYWGFFWHGQLHKYDFTFKNPGTALEFSGSQSLLHSTADVRLGFEF